MEQTTSRNPKGATTAEPSLTTNETAASGLKLEFVESFQKNVSEFLPGVVCWGDGLTAGAGGKGVSYPEVLEDLIADNFQDTMPVINCGVGGEDTNTIIGRAGGVPYIIAESFTIPPDTSKVKFVFTSSNGSPVAPLRQGDCGVNPVSINGITGNISIEQESYFGEDFSYNFSRGASGKPVEVKTGTPIYSNGSIQYRNFIPIIFIGQNGGWENNDELIAQQMSIVNFKTHNQDNFLILGLTTGNAASRASLETDLLNYYGDKYINLREYLSSDGIYDAGLEPTKQDLEAIKAGSVPPSLLSDSVHLNSYGYALIGRLVFERMVELGYFNNMVGMNNQDSN
jgi:hypothetical protein